MAVVVEQKGNQLKVTNGSKKDYINVDDFSVNITSGGDVIIFNNSTGKLIAQEPFGDFTTPSGGSAEALPLGQFGLQIDVTLVGQELVKPLLVGPV